MSIRKTLVGVAASLACVVPAMAVVVPNIQADVGGNAQGPAPFNYYGSLGSRNQVLYPASEFWHFDGEPKLITSIAFRPYPGSATSGFFSGTVDISNVLITLSTTNRTESGAQMLSANYADNIGSNVQTVYSGPLTLTTSATDDSNGVTKLFDYVIPLQSGFVYDPALGNLLLDVNIPNGAKVSGAGFGFVTFDNVNTNGDGLASVVNLQSGDATSGYVGTDAAIAHFEYTGASAVPEPTSVVLVVMGLFGTMLNRGQRSRRQI